VHPQVGAGGIRALSHARAPMTMGEVLGVLLGKARVEAEDAQRVLLAALNGLAGLLLLQGLPAEAARAYREALRLVAANAEHVRADRLQQLHAAHNLAEVLEGGGGGGGELPRTLRDGELRAQAATLREEYLAEAVARLAAAEAELAEAEAAVDKARDGLRRAAGPAAADGLLAAWWVDAAHLLAAHSPDGGAAAAQHIKDALSAGDVYRQVASRNASSMVSRFRDLRGLQVVLSGEVAELRRAGGAALAALRALGAEVAAPPAALVAAAAACQRCVPWGDGAVCRHCCLDETFVSWEVSEPPQGQSPGGGGREKTPRWAHAEADACAPPPPLLPFFAPALLPQVRLFSLVASAREAGGQVSAEEAARQVHAAMLRQVGRGGLGEAAGAGGAGEVGAARRTEGVARSEVVRHPSEAERALGLVLAALQQLRVPPGVAAQRGLVAAAARAHLEQMERARGVYLRARALALCQRQKLYSLDELEMCTQRMR
jgi:E3 ubiquitin-protein ligase SHPRH